MNESIPGRKNRKCKGPDAVSPVIMSTTRKWRVEDIGLERELQVTSVECHGS